MANTFIGFAEKKMWVALHCKTTHIFAAKNINVFENIEATTISVQVCHYQAC